MLLNKAEGLNIGIPLLLLVRLVVTSVAKTGMVMSNTTQIFRLVEKIFQFAEHLKIDLIKFGQVSGDLRLRIPHVNCYYLD